MNTSGAGRRRVATSWAVIGVGTAGVIGATTFAYADAVKAPSSETGAYPADMTLPVNGPIGSATATTSMAPSYSPRTYTRSRGS